ncbi:MAG: hypothetical protein COA78_10330 [Blastopirellula sp.]|nr:MAG: hypothetical protein COA78_10330 [Blastopirellula sp.]
MSWCRLIVSVKPIENYHLQYRGNELNLYINAIQLLIISGLLFTPNQCDAQYLSESFKSDSFSRQVFAEDSSSTFGDLSFIGLPEDELISVRLLKFDSADSPLLIPSEPDFLNTSYFQSAADATNSVSTGDSGTSAGDAIDPSVPLAQIQIQNNFITESYHASGYSNQIIIQPVIPFHLSEDGYFPYHIVRPTLPIIAPTANPDGDFGVQGGLGDLSILDIYVHPVKKLKTNFGLGYIAILPTSTHSGLGTGEFQIGPSAVVISSAIPNWKLGVLYQQPFSTETNKFSVNVQPLAVRVFENHSYLGWGTDFWKVSDQNGNYQLPLMVRTGKVVEIGEKRFNISLEAQYTPEGLHRDLGGKKFAIKLSVSRLLPSVNLQDPFFGR